jgi:hypothetical protein
MNVSALKGLVLGLAVFCAGLIVGNGLLCWHHGGALVQSSFADEQKAIIDEMRTQAL